MTSQLFNPSANLPLCELIRGIVGRAANRSRQRQPRKPSAEGRTPALPAVTQNDAAARSVALCPLRARAGTPSPR